MGIQSAKAHPDILPGLDGVGAVVDGGVGVDQERIPRGKLVAPVPAHVDPLPADHMVKQEVARRLTNFCQFLQIKRNVLVKTVEISVLRKKSVSLVDKR